VNIGYRTETIQLKNLFVDGNPPIVDPVLFALRDQQSGFLQARIEYVHDNTINPTQNIWEGLRFKIYGDFNTQIAGKADPNAQTNVYVLGFDARHYYPIYRNLTWAVRVAGDFSFGDNKFLYVLGGSDGWISPSIEAGNDPAPDDQYAFLGLAQNLRGFNQNVANGNNALVINSEVRLPVWSTFFNKPINNAFLRNFQLVQFFDLGTAWNGQYNSLKRPSIRYGSNGPLTARREAGGIGPFAGGYGFGVRSVLLGYFMKLDAAWEMNTFFGTKPIWHFSLGLDF
jgi:outer membrane protein assembly factor BamA